MTASGYKFEIQCADRARDLHELHSEVVADETLDRAQKNELCELIREKFCRLNRRREYPRPRW